MNRLNVLIMILTLWLASPQGVWAQESRPLDAPGWYGGLQGGVPLGVSTFSSFGADKVRAGYDFGLFGGYRFTPVLSAEISMKWGKTALSERDCCLDSRYLLGADGMRYLAPVAGLEGWNYADLKSSVALQQYALQLNVNVLGLFERTRQSRWTVEVSPLLAAVGTKAAIRTIAGDATVMQRGTEWHLGAGGNLQAGYRLTQQLHIGIYSGITYLTGRRMDGLPEHLHKSNYVWESGIRLGWSFGKRGKAEKRTPQVITAEQPREVTPGKVETPTVVPEKPETPRVVEPETVSVQPADSVAGKTGTAVVVAQKAAETNEAKKAAETNKAEVPALDFPVVYFAFNRTDIATSEETKLHAVCEMLKEHPDVDIIVTGWCDSRGSRAVNERISRLRAESVKSWLVRRGINPQRIRTQGMGTDRNEPVAAKARRTEIEEQEKEEQERRNDHE